jgi:hypothetical protein
VERDSQDLEQKRWKAQEILLELSNGVAVCRQPFSQQEPELITLKDTILPVNGRKVEGHQVVNDARRRQLRSQSPVLRPGWVVTLHLDCLCREDFQGQSVVEKLD